MCSIERCFNFLTLYRLQVSLIIQRCVLSLSLSLCSMQELLDALTFGDDKQVWSIENNEQDNAMFEKMLDALPHIDSASWTDACIVSALHAIDTLHISDDDDDGVTLTEDLQEKRRKNLANVSSHFPHTRLTRCYRVGRCIGRGGFGVVFQARMYLANERDGMLCALKVLPIKHLLLHNALECIQEETRILSRADYPHIVKLYDAFEDTRFVYHVLEYMPRGSVYDAARLTVTHRLDPLRVAKWTRQLVHTLIYLQHDMHVIHGDIKPENVLIDQHDNVKLADFGWSTVVDSHHQTSRKALRGTLDYLSPEILSKSRMTCYASDAWSLGAFVYECVYGHAPFECDDVQETYQKIREANVTFPPASSDTVPESCRQFIRSLLVVNASCRPSCTHMLASPFLTQYTDSNTSDSSSLK